jgi:hypothetical protein
MGRRFSSARRTAARRARRVALIVLATAIAVILASSAGAQQARDYMLTFQPQGSFAYVDYYGTGGMFTLEHRRQIFGNANELTLGASLIPSYPLGEAHARADLRILFLSIGGSLAYRTVWRNLEFEPGDDGEYCKACDRASRRKMDPLLEATPGSTTYEIAEARATVYLPFNDHLIALASGALRYEGRPDRSFDWFYTSLYDEGLIRRLEIQAFVKHPDFGGIGPYVQLLSLPRDGKHVAQWAAGFNLAFRVGILPRNDLIFWTLLVRPGDGEFGQHSYYSPVRSLLIYRMILDL